MPQAPAPGRHRLLARQLRRCTDSDGVLDLEKLLDAIDAAYAEHDEANALGHRAMTVAARELAETNESLSHARVAAETSRAKSLFLSNISHEIRTPLNAVVGMVEILAREDPKALNSEKLDVIRKASRHLVAIIDDIFDIALADVGDLELSLAPVDIGSTVRRAVSKHADNCRDKGLQFIVDIDPVLDGEWLADANHLGRTLSILTNNAVKFTETGHVRIEVRPTDSGITFSVTDTGPGMSQERLSDIFEIFTQIDASASRRAGGLGIGLAIARKRVEAMGGDLQVTSEPGRGSQFSFCLALDRYSAAARSWTSGITADHPLRILAAEDNPANRMVLKALLNTFVGEIQMATNGAEAVEMWAQGGFDAILMDIQMPTMNGIEATEEIRRREQIANLRPVPIVAVTANVMDDQLARYAVAGMNGWVAKPIELDALLSAISSAMLPDADPAPAEHTVAA
ncbi:ATP-binding protein [Brevundimonas subvibrioides]|uniref:ATP-binding protein n=1 Tax=Brevundimonas subvibrioides TaxID=74313 RepID=UPI0022B47217|nr:ATP-binding protein [Brevundimonas subvibrioides]